MFPDLINFGFLHLRTYGACMATGFLLCWMLVERLSGRKDLSNLLVSLMFAGVLGSRIAYVIEHWSSEFAADPLKVVRVDQGGLMFYGGLILAAAVYAVWCVRRREHPLALSDLLLTVVPLGHAFGRIGCFFYGCCYGRVSESAFAVTFPRLSPAWFEQYNAGLIPSDSARSLAVLPTQLFEAAALLVLFAVLVILYRRFASVRRGLVTGVYCIGYAVIRYSIECLRGDPRAAVGPFSISQTISLAVFAVGLLVIVPVCVRTADAVGERGDSDEKNA